MFPTSFQRQGTSLALPQTHFASKSHDENPRPLEHRSEAELHVEQFIHANMLQTTTSLFEKYGNLVRNQLETTGKPDVNLMMKQGVMKDYSNALQNHVGAIEKELQTRNNSKDWTA
jgi:hypothetical protein